MTKKLTIGELEPLGKVTTGAMQAIDLESLSPGAQVIVQTFRLGIKPRPERGWYGVSAASADGDVLQEYLYRDELIGKRRPRHPLGRISDLVEEIVIACQLVPPSGPLVDVEWLSATLKPTAYTPKKRTPPAKICRDILNAIDTYKDQNGGNSPLYIEIAKMTGYAPTTVTYNLQKLEKKGEVELRSGARSLVRLKGRWATGSREDDDDGQH